MSDLGPIEDSYIDSIIKANVSADPSSNKTLGVGLRKLVKDLRDRLEQEISNLGDQLSTEGTTRDDADKDLQNKITALSDDVVHNAKVGVPNGVVPLDGSGKVSASYLPSYVDDVLEFANLAALPTPGETGKIYITLDTNFEYRWSGSMYIKLVASPGSTDDVPQGSVNLYYTDARVKTLGDTLYAHKNGDNASGQWPINISGTAAAITGQANSATIGADAAANGNTIALRDGSGHVSANYFHTAAPINDGTTMGVFIGEDNGADGYLRPYSVSAAQAALGLNSGAYNDKTKLWSVSHPNDFYISNSWTGTYWLITSNHGAPVSVGHSDGSDVSQYLANDADNMRMHWNGQGGQPSWLWGGNDPANMYVYNPSNFNVNYANNSGALNGQPAGYYYPASNPNGYISGENDTLQSVTNRGNSTSNAIVAAGFYQSSLRDLKENIQDFKEDALTLLNALKVRSFNFKGSDEAMVGLVIDEVQGVNPVILNNEQTAINTNSLMAEMLKAIQQLTKRVEELENA